MQALGAAARAVQPDASRMGLACAALAWHFDRFRISASVIDARQPDAWHPVYYQRQRRDRTYWDLRFGLELERRRYNGAGLASVARSAEPELRVFGGHTDLFVPLVVRGAVLGFVVCGPFLREVPSAATIRSEWEALAKRPARDGDPDLLEYCRTVLDTPILEDGALNALSMLARTFGEVACGSADPDSVLGRMDAIGAELMAAYPFPRIWGVASGLVDPERSPGLQSAYSRELLHDLSLRGYPASAIVALARFTDEIERDPIARAVDVLELQRAAVGFSQSLPDSFAGKVAEEGVLLLIRTDGRRADERRRQIRDVAEQLRALARGYGARLFTGASVGVGDPSQLPRRYQEALISAERAAYEGRGLVLHEAPRRIVPVPATPAWHEHVVAIRRALVSGLGSTVRIEIDPLVSCVLARSAGSASAARAYFESAFLDAVAALGQRSAVEPSVLRTMVLGVEDALGRAPSSVAAAAAFRGAIAGLIAAVQRPTEVSREHRIERAVELIQGAIDEPLSLARVAKATGLSTAYFSRLFKRMKGVGFERFVRQQRIERARELLRATALPIHRVARDAGFGSYVAFELAFKKDVGVSPTSYRDKERGMS